MAKKIRIPNPKTQPTQQSITALTNAINRLTNAINNPPSKPTGNQPPPKASLGTKIATAVESVSNLVFGILNTVLKKRSIELNAAAELQNRAIETYGKTMGKTASVLASNITGTVLDTAFESLNTVMEGGVSMYMKNLKDSITIRKKENDIREQNIAIVKDSFKAAGEVASIFGEKGKIVGGIISALGSITTQSMEYMVARTKLEIERSEQVAKSVENTLSQVKSIVDPLVQMSKDINKIFLDLSESAYKFSRTLGLSGDAQLRYQESVVKSVNVALASVDMDFKDYAAMQQSYNDSNGGRASILSTNEALLIGGLSQRLGISAGESAAIAGSMNIFNTSIADGSEMIYDMAKTANKMGLNATKFAKDLEKNLKLAEKYQFRGGVKGMMDMALWAQKTRFNMDSITGMVEKALSGNIEDVIQTSARFNVLGGNEALFSDPMGILYDAMDPAAMAKRVRNMVKGYGTFNSATGETDFSRVEMLRMQQDAQISGMSREDIMNIARQSKKEKAIRNRYGRKFDKDTLEGLTQHATWSKEKNDWVVKVMAKNREGYVEKGLNDIAKNDREILKSIFPEDKQDTIIEYIKDIRQYLSPKELQSREDKRVRAETVSQGYEGLDKSNRNLAKLKGGVNTENAAKIAVRVTEETEAAQERINELINNDEKYYEVLDSYLNGTSEQFELLAQSLEDANNELYIFAKGGFAALNAALQETYGITAGPIDLKDFTNEMGARTKLTKEEAAMYNAQNYTIGNDALINEIAKATGLKRNAIKTNLAEGTHYYDYERGLYSNRKGTVYTPVDVKVYNEYIKSKSANDNSKNVNDAVITPRGAVYTHPDDMIAAFKPNGDILNGLNGNKVSKIEVSGTLRLDSGSQSVDLIKLINENPESIRRITEEVIVTANKNTFGGRAKYAPNRYTIG